MSEAIQEKLVDYFHHLVLALGAAAFEPKGSVLFYSGPSKELLELVELKRKPESFNHGRALGSAAVLNAHLLDDTRVGRLLFDEIQVYDTLRDIAGPDGIGYANAINTRISEMFAQHAEGKVYTAVCGADKDRIFYTTELPELIANKNVTHVNGYEADRYRRLFDVNAARAFQHVFQTEQRLVFAVAQNLGTKPAFVDHAERRDLRRADRRLLRDKDGKLLVGQILAAASQDARSKFVDRKLAERDRKVQDGTFKPWRAERLAETNANGSKLTL